MTTVALPSDRNRPANISQATAVEQSRAVAEVQAAVVVAQQIPRDMDRALGDMRDSCGRTALANRAFYSVPNRGAGPSVHLARELARTWGNIQYGVHELRRDDTAGESEIQAFAWDLQTNTRSTRTFVVPHARMKGRARQALTDLGDVYLNNQNIGARAVRECIFTVLPAWFTEEAQDTCKRTLEHGDGEPLEQRLTKMTDAFKGIGITVKQLEDRLERKRGTWTASDVARMGVVFRSIQSGDADKDEEFPPVRVAAEDITARRPAAPAAAPTEDVQERPTEPEGWS
jgi:hypothetical protein